MSDRPKIVVLGSLNVDHTLRVPRLPKPGETLAAHGAYTCFGGKGANQALAAARAGGDVALIGCVGNDDFGERHREYLEREGVDTQAVIDVPMPTGSAFIAVDDAGENSIVFNAGANGALKPEHVDAHIPVIRSAAALLIQLECPLATVLHAIHTAASSGIRVILNPSPLSPEFLESRAACDTVIANEHESASLAKMTLDEIQASPAAALDATRCRQLIVTRGSDPTLVITDEHVSIISPPKVTPVDTVGAGDAFAGAFAVALASGWAFDDAVRFANAAGALATQKPGAQSAIPQREQILALMRQQ
jgi:ribokinase